MGRVGHSSGSRPRVAGEKVRAKGSIVRELEGRVAVVTGGASGIGRALAHRFAAEGMRLVLADVEPAPLAATVAELEARGAEVVGVSADVAVAADVDAVRDRALAAFGAAHVV